MNGPEDAMMDLRLLQWLRWCNLRISLWAEISEKWFKNG